MSISENIKTLRTKADMTQAQLARKLGVTRATVTQWETGWSQPRMGMVEKLAQEFSVSLSDIVDDSSDSLSRLSIPGAKPVRGVSMSSVPLTGRVHAGKAGDPDVYEEVTEYVDIPQTYLDIDPECFAVDFEGDCMSKDFGDTTTLIVSPNSAFGNGSIVVVAIDGGDYVVRRMEQNARELRLKPNSWNPEYKDIVISRNEEHEVEFKGKVLGCFRRFE